MCDPNLIMDILHRDLRTMKTRNISDKSQHQNGLCSCDYYSNSTLSCNKLQKSSLQTPTTQCLLSSSSSSSSSINQLHSQQRSHESHRMLSPSSCDCRGSQSEPSSPSQPSDNINCMPTLSCRQNHQSRNIPSRNLSRNNYHFSLRFNVKRFGEVLILGACLLGILKFSTVYTAPAKRSMDLNSKPLWIFPCNSATEIGDEGSYQPSSMSKLDLLDLLSFQTLQALDHARSFKDEYVLETFNVNFDNHNKNWKSPPYEWLPNYKKDIGESTPLTELENVQLETLLKDGYRNLQVFAAALEQVIYDLEKYSNHKYLKYFKSTAERLHAVLCEFYDGMAECGIQPHPNVERSVMSDEFRNLKDSTDRNLRDWMIYREYIKALEYIHDALEHLKRQHREKQS